MITQEHPTFSLTEPVSPQEGYFFETKDLPPQLREASNSVGRVMGEEGLFGGCCLSIYKDRQYLLSARHCFLNRDGKFDRRRIIFPEGRSLVFDPKKLPCLDSDEEDLFVLPVTGINLRVKSLNISDDLAKVDRVIAFGYPDKYLAARNSKSPVASIGQINYLGSSSILVSARVEPGNSGGPVLDSVGNVIAITSEWRPRLGFSEMAIKYLECSEAYSLSTVCLAIKIASAIEIMASN
ncbi:MAG: serine protease [Candidatus Daviesbacteria bacterium]|nr:serine protease [Candidatus Daviesbacteria bacterium]